LPDRPAHLVAPRGVRENLEYRRWLVEECRLKPAFRPAVLKLCADDCLFYVNSEGR
jgi:hypothetical protein